MSEITLAKCDASLQHSSSMTTCLEAGHADDPLAIAHESKVKAELNAQFRELKCHAQGIFEAVKGRIGARNEDYLQQVFAKARDDYASGQFLIQRLGADRQLDLPLVATLTQLRHGLLEGLDHATTSDQMLADSAIVGYRNMLRVQGWLGSLCMEVERRLFGQLDPAVALGRVEAQEVEALIEKLEQQMLPMLERSQRVMIRALDRLEASRNRKGGTSVSIGVAGQVNVG